MAPRHRQARWLSWTINGRRMLSAAAGLSAVLALAVMPKAYETFYRLRWAIKPGVTLDGVPMGGLLPQEATGRLLTLVPRLRVAPSDARWDPDTGSVTPESPGRELDVELTLRRLLTARPFQRVSPAFITVLPSISRQHFRAIYRGPEDRPWVALAFNVDWGEEHLPAILDELARRDVKATFFLTGRWARRFPDMARLIAERGHEVGNHGMDHVHPKELSDADLNRLIEEADRLLEQLTSQRPRLFAPPYGEVGSRIVAAAARLGYYTIMWTVDTIDWQKPPPERIVARVRERLVNGAIVLMHPTPSTVRALPAILDLIQERGLLVVPVGKMAAATSQGTD